ncbi:MAG: ClpXP protease specificity-enhancing factor SspB [Pseudomonadota bacterium]
MTRSIEYGHLMHKAMRSLIMQVLADVAEDGLPGDHHFFITFDTRHPDVEIAEWLSERYPDEMTVVIQHWFEDLKVGADGFSVTLNFGDQPESIYLPYGAIRTFVDPSVEFGLRFETQNEEDSDEDDEDDDAVEEAAMAEDVEVEEVERHGDAEIVSLDSFRK